MLNSNINKHHKNTLDSYFHSVWYVEDIIMALLFLNSIFRDVVSIFLKIKFLFHTVVSIVYTKMTFYIEIGHFLEKKKLNNMTFEPQMSCMRNTTSK